MIEPEYAVIQKYITIENYSTLIEHKALHSNPGGRSTGMREISDDCLEMVFSYLNSNELFRVGIVDQHFLRLSNSERLWYLIGGAPFKYELPYLYQYDPTGFQFGRLPHLNHPTWIKPLSPKSYMQYFSRAKYARHIYFEHQRHKTENKYARGQKRRARRVQFFTSALICFGIPAIIFFLAASFVMDTKFYKSSLYAIAMYSFSLLCFFLLSGSFLKVYLLKFHKFEGKIMKLLLSSITGVLFAAFISSLLVITRFVVSPILWIFCFSPLIATFLLVAAISQFVLASEHKAKRLDCMDGGGKALRAVIRCGPFSSFCFAILVSLMGLRLDNMLNTSWEVTLIPLYILSVLAFVLLFVSLGSMFMFKCVFGICCCRLLGLMGGIALPVLLMMKLNNFVPVRWLVLSIIFCLVGVNVVINAMILVSRLNYDHLLLRPSRAPYQRYGVGWQ